jgi:hypothetical protein
MKKFPMILLLATLDVVPMLAQSPRYPPLSEYMMARDAEIALAKSAAPDYVSDHATIKVFTASGFQTVHQGDNGFVCMVMRGFTGAPTYTPVQVRDYINYDAKTRAPICLDPLAARTVLPYYELRTKLGLEGKTVEQIAEGIEAAYAKGEIPKRPEVCFAYMWSRPTDTRTGMAASNIFAAFSGDAGKPRSAAKAFAMPIGITPSAADVPTTLCST